MILKNLKKLLSLFFLAVLLVCCSNSNNEEVEEEKLNHFSDIPSGEIVQTNLRTLMLTGRENSTSNKNTQKWWTHLTSEYIFNNEDCRNRNNIHNAGYFAFANNGTLYIKLNKNDAASNGGRWKWTSSKKNKITITYRSGDQQDFTITYLNENNIIYASKQSKGECSLLMYQQFNNPFFE